jgi:hypothetical protein
LNALRRKQLALENASESCEGPYISCIM